MQLLCACFGAPAPRPPEPSAQAAPAPRDLGTLYVSEAEQVEERPSSCFVLYDVPQLRSSLDRSTVSFVSNFPGAGRAASQDLSEREAEGTAGIDAPRTTAGRGRRGWRRRRRVGGERVCAMARQ